MQAEIITSNQQLLNIFLLRAIQIRRRQCDVPLSHIHSSVTGSSVPTKCSYTRRCVSLLLCYRVNYSSTHFFSSPIAHCLLYPLFSKTHIQAGPIGTHGTPIFDAGKLPPNMLPNNQLHDLLIRDSKLGAALARTFIPDSLVRVLLQLSQSSFLHQQSINPFYPQIVLMTSHGLAIRAPSIRDAVFRAFYARQDAIVTLQTIQLLGVPAWKNAGNFGLTPREASDAEETTESDSL